PVGVVQAAIVMRGIGDRSPIKLVSPGGTRTLGAPREFRWQSDQQGLTYRFELADDTGRVVYRTDASDTSVQLPAGVKLAPETVYTWTVSTRAADGRRHSSSGDVAIASDDLRRQVDALRPDGKADFSDRVAYAAWLEQMGLKDEARSYWRTLAAERPGEERLAALARE